MEQAARAAVPVFPLPEVVLFPGVIMPLHVFELRYRTMIRDALSRDRTLALAVLTPGYENDYHGSPAFHSLGCLARIEEIEWLPNDRYDLRVVGTTRVRFGRVEREFPYRSVRVEMLPQHPYTEDDPLIRMEKQSLLELHARLGALAEAQGGEQAKLSMPQVGPADSYERVVNCLSTVCGRNADDRLALLAEDSVIERGRRVRDVFERVLGAGAASAARPPEPPSSGDQRN